MLQTPTPHNPARVAIIVAGGSGTRFGADVPKQFLPLDGLPVMMRTISKFALAGAAIITVLPAEQFDSWANLCRDHAFDVPHRLVAGGPTRFHSVLNAVKALDCDDNATVAVHDAVRPLASHSLIDTAFREAAAHRSAIPYVPATDSIRLLDKQNGDSQTIDRNRVALIQTPQVFEACTLRRAYRQEYDPLFTDDASVVEKIAADEGFRLHLIAGEQSNIKITYPKDLAMAEYFIREQR